MRNWILNVIWYLALESVVMLVKPAAGTELRVWKKKWVFYPTKLKLDFNSFWQENDLTVQKANLPFPFMAQKVHDSEKLIAIERNTKILL